MGVYGPGQSQQLHVRMLVASLWAALTAGFAYSFSAYSVALQQKFGLSQAQISSIGTAHIAVNLVTFTCGLLVDRVGVRTAIVGGSILNATSWFLFGAIATLGWDVPHSAVAFSILAALATYGAACTVAAVFSALAKNFSEERGAAIGIAKAWTGVASGIITALFMSCVPTADSDPKRLMFPWVLASSTVILALLPSPLIRVLSETTAPLKAQFKSDKTSKTHQSTLRWLFMATLALIGVTVAASLLEASAPRPVRAALSALIVTGVFAPGWLLLPARGLFSLSSSEQHTHSAEAASSTSGGHGLAEVGGVRERVSPWASGPLDIVRRVDGWLLWLSVFALQSGAILLTTNLGSIAQTRSGLPVSAATAVSLFSCAQSFGRLFGGFVSDAVVARRVARPWCLVVLLLGMSIAQALLILPGPMVLYAGVVLAGLSFGSMYPVMICTVAELFGTARVASNYMLFDGSPMALGCILVAKALAQAIYQSQVRNGTAVCHGDACFRLTFACASALQLCAAAAAVLLAVRSAVVYRLSVWPPRFEDVGEIVPHDRA